MRPSCTIRALLLGLLLSTAALQTVRADGVVRDGIGPISMGRGATNLGFADNAAIILENPAAMTRVEGNGLLELGLDTVFTDLHYTDPDNDVEGEPRAYPVGMFGYIHRNPCSPWAWGIGVFAPAGFGAEFNMVNPHTGPAKYESFGMLVKILPAVAYQVTDRLSIGATLGVAIGHNELEGPFYVQTGPFAGTPTLMDLQATGAAVAGGIGLQYCLTPRTTIGIAYNERTDLDLDGNARATLITPPPPFGFGLQDSEFDLEANLTWPRSLGIGIKHELGCCRRLGLDVVWYDWSDAFDELELNFSDPSNPIVAAVLGSEFTDTLAMNWDDSISLRVGYEWDDGCWTWRLGYVYHESPAPNETLNPYLDGVLEHALNVGLTYRLGHGDLNLAYQYSFGPERDVTDSTLAGDDFDNSTFEAQAHWLALSVLFPY
jgi:long-chain fatty acid transport protein